MSLTALGDFPTRDLEVVQLPAGGAPLSPVTQFATGTLALSATAPNASGSARTFGWASLTSLAMDASLVLRPVGVSCPLADPEARLPIGAAIAVIDEARVMFVGGLDASGLATRRIAVLHTREETVELPSVARAVPIAFAAATLVPGTDQVLVSGGASVDGGAGRDTWESIRLDGGMAGLGALDGPRRDHASIAATIRGVPGVLLIGGTDGRSLVRTIEWIDPVSGTGRVLMSRLGTLRTSPILVPLDDHRIAIVGGVDETGRAATAIEILDVAADHMASLSLSLTAPDWIAPLPSGRLAWASAGSLAIVALREAQVIASVAALPTVVTPLAVATPRGHVVLEGRASDGSRVAFVIDPGTGSVAPTSASRVPRGLVAVPGGTTLELAASGASIRLDDEVTPFDSPPPTYLFAADRARLALDAARQWAATAGTLSPAAGVDAARLDVPVLRFAHFEALIDATGAYDVVLTGEHLETLATVAVTDTMVQYGTCSFARAPTDGRVRIERGLTNSLRVNTEHGSLGCFTQHDAALRVGIGIVAHTGAALRSLALQRDLGWQ